LSAEHTLTIHFFDVFFSVPSLAKYLVQLVTNAGCVKRRLPTLVGVPAVDWFGTDDSQETLSLP